jgi:hypothetical protein
MKIGHLNWVMFENEWWYLPTHSSLTVFDANTGEKQAEWIVESTHNIACKTNLLYDRDRYGIATIVEIWKTYLYGR